MNTFLSIVKSVMNIGISLGTAHSMLQYDQSSKSNREMDSLKSRSARNNLIKNPTRVMGVGTSIVTPLNPSTIYQRKNRLIILTNQWTYKTTMEKRNKSRI